MLVTITGLWFRHGIRIKQMARVGTRREFVITHVTIESAVHERAKNK